MKRNGFKVMAFGLALAALSCGCATVKYSDEGGKHMVNIVNTGWYLLDLIPLASGNPELPNECSFRLFRQTTTLQNNIKMLDYAVTERDATDVRSVKSYWTDETVLFILLKRHECHTSAELVLDAAPAGAPTGAQSETEAQTYDGNPTCELLNQ